MNVASVSPWFTPIGAVLDVESATKSEWFDVVAKALSLEQQLLAAIDTDGKSAVLDNRNEFLLPADRAVDVSPWFTNAGGR